MERRIFCLITMLWLTTTTVVGANQESDEELPSLTSTQKENIRSFINSLLQCTGLQGISMTVVNNDEVLMAEGFGYANSESMEPMTGSTLFTIASTTKAFTATLLAMLLHETKDEDGKQRFSWSSRMKDILDDFELYDTFLTENVRLEDVMGHKTGISDFLLPLVTGIPTQPARETLLKRMKYLKPVAELREKFMYNNIMYAWAGYVAEKLSAGQTYESLLRSRIFEPLGMTSTTFIDDSTDWEKLVTPYVRSNNSVFPIDKKMVWQINGAEPAAGILSTAEDMAKWIQFNLNKGQVTDGESLLPENALEELYKANTYAGGGWFKPKYPVSRVRLSYGMGWERIVYRGYAQFSHSGRILDNQIQVHFYPRGNFGYFLASNGPSQYDPPALHLIAMYISDLLLGEEPWLTSENACTFPEPWFPKQNVTGNGKPPFPTDLPSDSLEDYIGEYNNPGFGDITILLNVDGDKLFMYFGQFMEACLHHNASENTFYTEMTGQLWFMEERYPVRFEKQYSDHAYDTLYIPMNNPNDEAFPFMNGQAREVRDENFEKSNTKDLCSRASYSFETVNMLLVMTLFVGLTCFV